MGHTMLNGVYDWQDGPRGDEQAFLAGHGHGHRRAATSPAATR